MFKKSKPASAPDLFASPSFSMTERERKYMEDAKSWHNEFYRNVTSNIDEEILRPLFVEGNMGAPTANTRILIGHRKGTRKKWKLQIWGIENTDFCFVLAKLEGESEVSGRKKNPATKAWGDSRWKMILLNHKDKITYSLPLEFHGV